MSAFSLREFKSASHRNGGPETKGELGFGTRGTFRERGSTVLDGVGSMCRPSLATGPAALCSAQLRHGPQWFGTTRQGLVMDAAGNRGGSPHQRPHCSAGSVQACRLLARGRAPCSWAPWGLSGTLHTTLVLERVSGTSRRRPCAHCSRWGLLAILPVGVLPWVSCRGCPQAFYLEER